MRDKVKEGLITAKELIKEEVGREIGGLMAFAGYSPWMFGRYITFEVLFFIVWIYSVKTGKKLTWTEK